LFPPTKEIDMTSKTSARIKSIAYWVTTVFGPASFVVGGTLHLLRPPEVMAGLAHLGYPAYFATILGVGKLAGAIVCAVPGLPRLKEWAYAGFCFDLIAAAYSRAAVGDGAGDIIAPLVFLALVVASWALRPASRKLASAGRVEAPVVHQVTDQELGRRAAGFYSQNAA
jgi:uncharacterized membrane protein YphA (DoxX/SURF4 family)